jgi:hypothetical protein
VEEENPGACPGATIFSSDTAHQQRFQRISQSGLSDEFRRFGNYPSNDETPSKQLEDASEFLPRDHTCESISGISTVVNALF